MCSRRQLQKINFFTFKICGMALKLKHNKNKLFLFFVFFIFLLLVVDVIGKKLFATLYTGIYIYPLGIIQDITWQTYNNWTSGGIKI